MNEGMAMTVTSNSGIYDGQPTGNITFWPNHIYPNVWPQQTYYYHVTEPPRECSGDVHVFPCPHCDKCKCGAATVKRTKRAK